MRKGRISEEEKTIIKSMREDDKGYTEISRELGCSKDRVKMYCQRNGLGGYRNSKQNNPEEAFELFLENFNKQYGDRYLYIGGYTHSDNDVIIECKQCFTQRNIGAVSIRKNRPLICTKCAQLKKNKMSIGRRLVKILIKELNLKEQEKQRQKELKTVCVECGEEFIGTSRGMKYCSERCMNRYQGRIKEIRRRKRIKTNGRVDLDLTLTKLIKRDENICHICNSKCNNKDYHHTKEGHFIVGNNYPSLDHVVPISKGGTHTWDNVKLAHHYCNTIKNNNVIYEEGTGQLKMIG